MIHSSTSRHFLSRWLKVHARVNSFFTPIMTEWFCVGFQHLSKYINFIHSTGNLLLFELTVLLVRAIYRLSLCTIPQFAFSQFLNEAGIMHFNRHNSPFMRVYCCVHLITSSLRLKCIFISVIHLLL